MDDYIKLPMSFGLEISKILSTKYNIEPRKNKYGMLNLEYTKDELKLIEELTITNPARNSLDGIENLSNLKHLTIETFMNKGYRQNKSIASISSKDINKISHLSSLETLNIINQNGINDIDLSHLINLKKIKIIENTNLVNIDGLLNLKHLSSIELYENKNLFDIKNLNKIITSNELSKLVLSLLYYSDSVAYDKKTLNIDMSSLNKMVSLQDNCYFIEVPSDLSIIKIKPTDALKFHQKCISIINDKFNGDIDALGYIIGIEEYLTRNVHYDYEALKHNNTHMNESNKTGPSNGSNGAYNTIMYNAATCEGYPRAMIYLLKQVGLNSHLINCCDYNKDNSYALPDDGTHSVVSINSYYNLYCDPCWDAAKYNNGDMSYLPFALLSKDEISRTHSLMYDEKSTGNEDITIPRNIIETYLKTDEKVI